MIITRIIYTDSLTAIAWFRNKKTASKNPVADLFRAECFLKALSARIDTIQVIRWKRDEWGRNPRGLRQEIRYL